MRNSQIIRPVVAFAAAMAMAWALAACSAPKFVDSVFKKEQDAVRQDGQTYYVISAGLPVHAKASASSKVLGSLARYEKVTRTRLENGYAFITSANGRLKGWVDNGRLDWRIPAKEAPDRGESGQPAPFTDSPDPSTQVPAVTAPEEIPVPAPEVSGGSVEPVVEAPAAPEEPADIDVPVSDPEPESQKPAANGGGSKPAPSIFDSF